MKNFFIENSNLLKKIIWSVFSKFFIVLCGIFVSGILARSLNENDFGLYAISLSIISTFSFLGSLGLHLSISKHYHSFTNKSILNNFIFIISLIGTVLLSLVYCFILIFNDGIALGLRNIFNYLFIISIVFSLIKIAADYFRATQRIKLFLFLNTISSGGGAILWTLFISKIFLLNYFNLISLNNILFVLLTSSIITLFISLFILKKEFHFTTVNFLSSINQREFLPFFKSSMSFMIINLLFQFSALFPIWFIGIVFSPIEAGYFFASAKICSMVLVPLSVIDIIFPSDIAKKFDNESKSELQILISKLSTIRFFSSIVIFLIIYIFSSEIISTIYGNNFIVIDKLLKILLFFYLPQFVFGPTRQLLTMTNARNILITTDIFLVLISLIVYVCILDIITLETFVFIFSGLSFLRYFLYFIISYYFVKINPLPNPIIFSKKNV